MRTKKTETFVSCFEHCNTGWMQNAETFYTHKPLQQSQHRNILYTSKFQRSAYSAQQRRLEQPSIDYLVTVAIVATF